jgi:hypothetical protein
MTYVIMVPVSSVAGRRASLVGKERYGPLHDLPYQRGAG